MSKGDLDADLYGDLYGGDEADFGGDFDTSAAAPAAPAPKAPAPAPSSNTTSTNPPAAEKAPLARPAAPKTDEAPKKPVSTSLPKPPSSSSTPAPTAHNSLPKAPVSAIPTYNSDYNTPSNSSSSYNRPAATSSIPVFTDDAASASTNVRPAAGGYNNQYVNANGERSIRPSEMRDEGKMFVGGLNWDTTDESLRGYFSEFGKIDACTIMRDAAGRSRGFAFLTFEDPAAVNAVMVREHFLDGKVIDPKRAIPRLEHHRTQKIFVGGLAPSVSTESMREFFSQFGKVVDATVMVDRDSSRSKGFGFVTFEDAPAVEKLVQIQNLELEGKMIEVKLAQPRGAGGLGQQVASSSPYQAGGGPRQQQQQAPQMPPQAQAGAFDPQAMAMLYQRMFQQMGAVGAPGGGAGAWNPQQMNPMMMNQMMGMGRGMGPQGMMMGGMNPMMNPMMGRGAPMGMGMQGMPQPGGMSPQQSGGASPGHGSIPRGPAAMRGGMPGGAAGSHQGQTQTPPSGSVGPTRFGTKGQHSYHPYGR